MNSNPSSPTAKPAQKPIPPLDLRPQVHALRQELDNAIGRVLDSAQFIGGPEVRALEQEVAQWLGVEHAVGVNSGTDALVIALRALGVGCGDEVIVPSFSFVATAEAVNLVNATPVFVDIDPATYNLDPDLIESAITDKTRAVIPVHLFGQPADMDAIRQIARRLGLWVLEDAAQAMGARYHNENVGAMGHAASFSFFPTKTLGAFGDGGMIVTNDPSVAQTARKLANHGSVEKYRNEMIGYNSRLDAMQAAILRVKLPYLSQANEARRRIAGRYDAAIARIPGVFSPAPAEQSRHVYHQYTVRISGADRDTVVQRMKERGVICMVYYPLSLPRLPVYDPHYRHVQVPIADAAAKQVLSLPIWPEMTPDQQETVIAALGESVSLG